MINHCIFLIIIIKYIKNISRGGKFGKWAENTNFIAREKILFPRKKGEGVIHFFR